MLCAVAAIHTRHAGRMAGQHIAVINAFGGNLARLRQKVLDMAGKAGVPTAPLALLGGEQGLHGVGA